METQAFLIHALSPLHAGTGQGVEVIDLPVARNRSTGMPIVPGSSIKGVLRAAQQESDEDTCRAVFGPDTANASDHAGALSVGDARLLALPVRSFRGTFAWVTSPLLLALARRDMGSQAPDAPALLTGLQARVASLATSLNAHGKGREAKVYLEDLDLPATEDPGLAAWAEALSRHVAPDRAEMFERRFVVVDDETMTFLWETATQVDTRVRLQAETRTVAKGALWLEESLPPETLLIGVLAAEQSRSRKVKLSASEVLESALKGRTILQLGGKASIGRGRCVMVRLGGSQ